MSCIVGISDNGRLYMGGDSAGVNRSTQALELRADSKVFTNGKYLVGVAGSCRASQEIRYNRLPDPTALAKADPFRFMVEEILPAIRMVHGTADDFTALIGYRGRLFHLYGTEQVMEEQAGFDACGCGEPYAKGSLFSTNHEPHVSPEVRIKLALQAAERFSSGVRGPFNILEL